MTLDMRAAVKIQASVDGTAQVQGLERQLNNLDKSATGLQGVFGRLKGAAGGLTNALGGLVPAIGIAGLATMGKRAIDAADNLNDLRQKTGVSVETLSRFGAAARDAGSNLDEVAKAMGRLAKGIVDPASKANEALKGMGINSRDAAGNLKSMDQIMLEIADRFAKMPDGAQKTALAMQLFGKSGANLIPMLNQGRDALSKYQATMSGEMAAGADKFNDAINNLGRSLAGPFNQAITALLPAITQFANGLASLAQWFGGLPQPLQVIIIAVGSLGAAFVVLAPAINAVIGLIAIIGPSLAAIGPIFTGIGAAITAFAPILVGLFTGPVGWIALLVAAGVAIYTFRDKIGAAFQAIGQVLTAAAQGFYNIFIKPVGNWFTGLYNGIVTAFSKLAEVLKAPFQAVANFIRGIVNGILGGIEGAINGAIGALNKIIAGANRALAIVKAPQIPFIPSVALPRFAEGGMVTGPTVAMVGEGGEPEYIVPQSKAAGFAANWMAGKRGAGAIPRFAEGGVAMPSTANVSIQTGPVTQMNGTNYVTTQDMSRAVQAGVQQTLALLRNDLNTRRAVGIA